MSTYLYDEAIVNKFKEWTEVSQIQVYGPNETRRLFEVIADKNNDKPLKLPIISLVRDRGFKIINSGTTRRPLSYDGKLLNADEDSGTMLNAIPISVSYQVDIYTRYAKEADILVRNLIFNVVNYPALKVLVPKAMVYDEELKDYDYFYHTARIELGDDTVQDNSNEKERFIEGNFTKLSFLITIDDAYLWDTREHRNAEIEIQIDDRYET